jgi:hypothetical protein
VLRGGTDVSVGKCNKISSRPDLVSCFKNNIEKFNVSGLFHNSACPAGEIAGDPLLVTFPPAVEAEFYPRRNNALLSHASGGLELEGGCSHFLRIQFFLGQRLLSPRPCLHEKLCLFLFYQKTFDQIVGLKDLNLDLFQIESMPPISYGFHGFIGIIPLL